MNSEKITLPNNQTILDAIKELHSGISELHAEMNARFEQVDGRFVQVDGRFEQVDGRFEQIDKRFEQVDRRFVQIDGRFEQIDIRDQEMRLLMMSFDVQLDRLEATISEVRGITLNTRADVKVLRAEVHTWSKDISDLQLKVA